MCTEMATCERMHGAAACALPASASEHSHSTKCSATVQGASRGSVMEYFCAKQQLRLLCASLLCLSLLACLCAACARVSTGALLRCCSMMPACCMRAPGRCQLHCCCISQQRASCTAL